MPDTKKLTNLALLTALALILFIVELRLPNPVPVPGIKLGLANVVIVYAVYHYNAGEVMLMVAVKIVSGAVFAGNMVALIYSLSGSVLCLCGMLFLRKILSEKRIWLCSIFGAVLHNIGQILAAVLITQTVAVALYLPILIVSGCIAGAVTGLCAQIAVRRISKLKSGV